MPEEMIEILYKGDHFLKKILEDTGSCEDSVRFLRFLIWENPDVTSAVLHEVIGVVSINKR
jgi:hypothetical protein